MALELRQLTPHFAAEATGVALNRPLDADTVRAIDAAMDRYGVLVFRNQPLTQDEQMALGRAFGPLDMGFKRVKKGGPERLQYAELADISNVGADGKPVARDSRKVVGNIANQLWHSDSSFQNPPARYSMLSAVTLPSWGGDTEYCDLRVAYDGLTAREKAEFADMQVEHYALHSRFLLGDTDYDEVQRNALPPVTWPLVRTHPSGRKLLFIGVHARGIPGMSVAEGRALLMDLLEHATRPEYVYRHAWQVGDLVIWDNRATLHRGRRYDLSEPRELRRVTTEDVAPALESAA
ncbi:TauD/TfdA dioxygenase family protein [Roseomonas sp. BN140053]|uniref:TauD/TfdA dioxygenase family protein n=1 Tax=Roseomonas sp. BN140053 TaxID=3391898 RepID=UPI0039E98BD0